MSDETAQTSPAPEAPPAVKKTGGAPKGNANRVTSGLRALSATGRVPLRMKGGHHLRRELRAMRRELIAELTALRGREPSLYELALLNSATRHEARARLLERYLCLQHEQEALTTSAAQVKGGMKTTMSRTLGLTVEQRADLLVKIGHASDARDRVLQKLGLDVAARERSPWESLKSITAVPVSPASMPPTHHDCSGSVGETGNGPEVIPDAG